MTDGPEILDDPHAQLVRKVAWLRWGALLETAVYLVLLACLLSGWRTGVKLTGAIHGMIWIGFVAMLLGLMRPLGWSRSWVGWMVVTGPIGAILVHQRIRREGVTRAAAPPTRPAPA